MNLAGHQLACQGAPKRTRSLAEEDYMPATKMRDLVRSRRTSPMKTRKFFWLRSKSGTTMKSLDLMMTLLALEQGRGAQSSHPSKKKK